MKTTIICLRIEEDLLQQFDEICNEQDRKRSNMIHWLMKEIVEKTQKSNRKKK